MSLFAGRGIGIENVDGSFVDCEINCPRNLLFDPHYPSRVFVAHSSNIRMIENRVVSTLVGDGMGSPHGMALMADGESLLFCDMENHVIRVVNIRTRQKNSVVGDLGENRDGHGFTAAIENPRFCIWNRLTPEPKTELFITSRFKLRRLDVTTSRNIIHFSSETVFYLFFFQMYSQLSKLT